MANLRAVIYDRQVVVDQETLGYGPEVLLEITDGKIEAIQVPLQPGQE
jgi:hypothetical protein